MRLPDFIRTHTHDIITEWAAFAKTMTPAADTMNDLQLKDHVAQILTFIANDIELPQTKATQREKSLGGLDGTLEHEKDSAAEIHGDLRHESGFDIVQMFAEYRALRASIVKLWADENKDLTNADIFDLTRFNESIDQALAESVVRFVKKVDYSKDLLLGVLGHDIRSPIGAIHMSAQLMPLVGTLNEKQAALNQQIEDSSERVTHIVADLLDLTRARTGTGLPVKKLPMDMTELSTQIIGEKRIQFPDRSIELQLTGDLAGEWDSIRLGQVLSNLIGNALQYGVDDRPVHVAIIGTDTAVVLSVHNEGNPISADKQVTLFQAFTRGENSASRKESSNLGLGLFICKEVVAAHDGSITVTSDEVSGTIFRVELPKH